MNIKNTYIPLVFILLISCKSSLQQKILKNKDVFSITIGGCFENDNVTIGLNGIDIFQNKIISSDKILSTSGYYFSYFKFKDEGKLIIQVKEERKELDVYIKNQEYKVTVTINGFKNYFLLDLSKGRNIMIEKCTENRHLGIAEIKYYKGIIYLD